MKRIALAIAAALLMAAPASATAPREIGAATLVGEARFTLLGLALFDAALYSETGRFSWDDDFALSLTYRRAAPREVLISRTMRGMSERGAGDAARLVELRRRLETCFLDVARGDRFTGVSTGTDTAIFYLNGAQRCTVSWPGFREAFFGIWLDAGGAQADVSARLRGR